MHIKIILLADLDKSNSLVETRYIDFEVPIMYLCDLSIEGTTTCV